MHRQETPHPTVLHWWKRNYRDVLPHINRRSDPARKPPCPVLRPARHLRSEGIGNPRNKCADRGIRHCPNHSHNFAAPQPGFLPHRERRCLLWLGESPEHSFLPARFAGIGRFACQWCSRASAPAPLVWYEAHLPDR